MARYPTRIIGEGKRYLHKFSVCGVGRFPIDMLRYDACYPASEQDSAMIDDIREPRVIELVAVHHSKAFTPTVARWGSFCWRVVS